MSNVYDIDHKRRRAEQRAVEASTWIAKMDQGLGETETDALQGNFDVVSERADERTIVLSARENSTRDVSH